MIVARVGEEVSIGPHAGILYASAPEIYPVVAKFSASMTDPEFPKDRRVSWEVTARELVSMLNSAAMRFPFQQSEARAYPSFNPPELRAEGRIKVLLMLKCSRTTEYYADYFTLGRTVVNGRGVMTIEFTPSPQSSDPLQ